MTGQQQKEVLNLTYDEYRQNPGLIYDDTAPKKEVAVMVIIVPETKHNPAGILLTRRSKEISNPNILVSPGGHIDKRGKGTKTTTESKFSAATREIFEETSINKKLRYMGSLESHLYGPSRALVHPVVAFYDATPEENLHEIPFNKKEVSEIVFLPLDQLVDQQNWGKKNVSFETGSKIINLELPTFSISHGDKTDIIKGLYASIFNDIAKGYDFDLDKIKNSMNIRLKKSDNRGQKTELQNLLERGDSGKSFCDSVKNAQSNKPWELGS